MVFREWAMANMVFTLVVLPMGLLALTAAIVIFGNRSRGGTLFRRGVMTTPLLFAVSLYYAWVLNGSAARALMYALLASIVHLLWAWVLDRGTRGSSQRDRPPMQ